MKNLIILTILIIVSSACSIIVPVQQTYVTSPVSATTTKSFEEVWVKIIDILSTKGIQIKLLDKSSGLIVSEPYRLSTTWEDINTGKLADEAAYVVADKYYFMDNFNSSYISTGTFNIRVKTQESQTIVVVNLVNINSSNILPGQPPKVLDSKTTGVLEKELLQTIIH